MDQGHQQLSGTTILNNIIFFEQDELFVKLTIQKQLLHRKSTKTVTKYHIFVGTMYKTFT